MGRLSDARKKAKAKQPGATSGGGDEIVRPQLPETPAPAETERTAAEPAGDLAYGDDDFAAAFEPAPARGTTKLPSSGLADDILAAATAKPAPVKARKTLPPSGLADDILGEPSAPAPPAAEPVKGKLPAASGLADEILGLAAEPSSLADEILGGLADEPPRSEALAGEILAAMGGQPAAGSGNDDSAIEQGLEAGVLDALFDAPRAAPRSLPSSGLAEDILHEAPQRQGRTPLALDEIHEFESFFEDERHEIEQLHLVLFRVATEQFAVEIDRVHEVIRVPSITRVPHLAAHIRGVVNLRGRIVPVMDLRLLMNLPPRGIDRMSRIMVLDLAKKQIGILVDLVSEVLHVSVADVEPPPDEMRAIDRNLVTAVARADKRMIFILDMDKVLALK